MATEYIQVTGYAGYARVYAPDTAFNATKWKMDFYPENDEEWKKIVDAGVQKKRKTNTDVEKGCPAMDFISLSRPVMQVIKGDIINFTGPIVTMDDKVVVDYINKETNKRVHQFTNADKDVVERRGKPILIGNGSKVKIVIAVYDTVRGKGTRLNEVDILELVEFVPEEKELPEVIEDVRSSVSVMEEETKPASDNKVDW